MNIKNGEILKVSDLTYRVDNKYIIKNIAMTVKKGEFIGIIGPNGCGKTTLLKNIYGTLKPLSGSILLNGQNIRMLSNRQRAKQMAVMLQENYVEFDINVMDMVLLGRYAHKKRLGGMSREDLDTAAASLAKVGMSDYAKRNYLSLSGGEKQRILIARALTQKSDFIVLDEPTNHLDIKYQLEIMEILSKEDITVLSSIHDLNLAAYYCDRIYMMKQGQVVYEGSAHSILTEDKIKEVFEVKAQVGCNEITKKRQIYFLP